MYKAVMFKKLYFWICFVGCQLYRWNNLFHSCNIKMYNRSRLVKNNIFVVLIAPFSVDSSNQNYQKDVPEDKMDFHSLIEIDGQLTYQKKTNATSFFELKNWNKLSLKFCYKNIFIVRSANFAPCDMVNPENRTNHAFLMSNITRNPMTSFTDDDEWVIRWIRRHDWWLRGGGLQWMSFQALWLAVHDARPFNTRTFIIFHQLSPITESPESCTRGIKELKYYQKQTKNKKIFYSKIIKKSDKKSNDTKSENC